MVAVAEPFKIDVPDEVLADLKSRLSTSRIVPNEVGAGQFDPNGSWSYGTDRSTLIEFVQYWLEVYDWRKEEAKLNAVSHFKMKVNDLRIHFVHERSSQADAIPLLLVHGWPGSVVEFLKVIPRLRDAGFHVVAPSIPGFGWSDAPTEPGADVAFMAEHMNELMLQLGYAQYVAQGGDWGSIITAVCAYRFPNRCVAYHTNMPVPMTLPSDMYGMVRLLFGLVTMSRKERQGVRDTMYFMRYEDAYQRIQGTKPQSLSFGLNDSPTGLLAWLLEKFQSWSECGRAGPEQSGLTKDEILTNVMVYWTTQTIASSCRIYYETFGHAPVKRNQQYILGSPLNYHGYIPVPTGIILSPSEIFKFPRIVAELSYNLKHVTSPSVGGHFFAFEQPDMFVEDVVTFFKKVIDFGECKSSCPKFGQGRKMEHGRIIMYLTLFVLFGFGVRQRVMSRL